MFSTAVTIGIGANLGDACATVMSAVRALGRGPVFDGVLSGLYGSTPVGPLPQPDYVNAVLAAQTTWSPSAVLAHLQEVERAHGRQRGLRWGPRSLDLDLLTYGDLVSDDPLLTLPHPGIAARGFVLVPLCDLRPDWIHPSLGVTFRSLLSSWVLRNARHSELVWPLAVPRRASLPEVA